MGLLPPLDGLGDGLLPRGGESLAAESAITVGLSIPKTTSTGGLSSGSAAAVSLTSVACISPANPTSDSGYSVDYPEERVEGFQVTVFVGEERATPP